MSFKPNPLFEAQFKPIVRERALRPAARKIAMRAATIVHSTRPNRSHRPIEVSEVDGEVAVVNTNYGGPIEEFGSVESPAYAPLRRGVRAAGYRLHES